MQAEEQLPGGSRGLTGLRFLSCLSSALWTMRGCWTWNERTPKSRSKVACPRMWHSCNRAGGGTRGSVTACDKQRTQRSASAGVHRSPPSARGPPGASWERARRLRLVLVELVREEPLRRGQQKRGSREALGERAAPGTKASDKQERDQPGWRLAGREAGGALRRT